MDQRLEKALNYSNYMVTLNNQRRFLQEKFYQDTIFYFQGGQFTVNKELICFCFTMITKGHTSLVIVDDNDMPIDIEDLIKFDNDINNIYFSAANNFLNEYNLLKKNRTIESLTEL